MGFVDEMTALVRGTKKRHADDPETDGPELSEAGVSIKPHDPRLRDGIRSTDRLSPAEREQLRRHRELKN